jgi:hypothetical protein
MINPQYTRLAGASTPTAPIKVTMVAEMLKVGADPAIPIATECTNPNESFLSSADIACCSLVYSMRMSAQLI